MFEAFSDTNTSVMAAASESIYGQALSRQIRYERYCEIPEGVRHVELSPNRRDGISQAWAEDWLDVDVNNLQHNVFTALLAKGLCETEGTDPETTELVVRSLLVHDLKEYVINVDTDAGDLTYDDAVRQGEAGYRQEHQELGMILRSSIFDMLDDDAVSAIEAALNDSKKPEPQSEAGKMIEIAERTGYVHSAINAFDAFVGGDDFEAVPSDTQRLMFCWMSENVLANHISRLVELSQTSPATEYFLSARSSDITDIFMTLSHPDMLAKIGKFYAEEGKDSPETRRAKFLEAYDDWTGYVLGETDAEIHVDTFIGPR